MPTAATRKASPSKAAPVEEPDEDEFEEMDDETDAPEDDDLDELEEADEDETPAPKKRTTKKASAATDGEKPKRKPPVRPVIEHSSAWLAAHVTEVTGETYDARGIRMLLRKMASDGTLKRVVGEDRNRYEFTGPEDATVKAVITMIQSGEAKALKQAGLEKVKADAALKREAKKAAKAKAAPEVDEDEDVEELEDEPEETPKPRTRRAAPTKTPAPAKATAAPRTRRAAAK